MPAATLRHLTAAILLAITAGPAPAASQQGSTQVDSPVGEGRPASPAAGLPLRRATASTADTTAWSPLLAVLSLAGIGAGLWLWRRGAGHSPFHRSAGRRQPAVLVRISSQALTAQASVHTVRWNGEEYLVGCTAQQVTLLGRRPAPPPAGDAQ